MGQGDGAASLARPARRSERAAYLAAYTRRIAETYPPLVDGKVMLRFPRLFVVAVRRAVVQRQNTAAAHLAAGALHVRV